MKSLIRKSRVTAEDHRQLIAGGVIGAGVVATQFAEQTVFRYRTVIHTDGIKAAVCIPSHILQSKVRQAQGVDITHI